MTTKDNLPEPVKQETADLVVYMPPAEFEVIDVGPGEQITFENFGDTFTGIFESMDEQPDKKGEPFLVARFIGSDGMPYVIFPGAHLTRVLGTLEAKTWVRLTYTFDVDVKKQSPMKCFTVEVGR